MAAAFKPTALYFCLFLIGFLSAAPAWSEDETVPPGTYIKHGNKGLTEGLTADWTFSAQFVIAQPGETIALPLVLIRREGATEAPAALTARFNYDPVVIDPILTDGQFGLEVNAELSNLLLLWYQKGLDSAVNMPGQISYVVSGINSYEITTFDDQIPSDIFETHDPNDQVNPFPLGSMLFRVTGQPGDETPIAFFDTSLATGEATAIASQAILDAEIKIVANTTLTAIDVLDVNNTVLIGPVSTQPGASFLVPVFLFRGAEALRSPAEITFSLTFDSSKLDFDNAKFESLLLSTWYGRSMEVVENGAGRIDVTIDWNGLAGAEDWSMTGFDDQRPSGDNSRINPFPLGFLPFQVTGGAAGDVVSLPVSNLTMADANGDGLVQLSAIGGSVSVTNGLDTDGDGMTDSFETVNNLDETDPSDAGEDADQGGLTNLQEFILGLDPQDPSDDGPAHVYVAGGFGSDAAAGTESAPVKTITRGLQIAETMAFPFRRAIVHVGPGVYQEYVELPPNVIIEGENPLSTTIRHFNSVDPAHRVVLMRENSALRNVTVTLPTSTPNDVLVTLVDIPEVVADLNNCIIDGSNGFLTFGLNITGQASSGSSISDCTFRNLRWGVQAINSGAALARNDFEGIVSTAVSVLLPAEKGQNESDVNVRLGDQETLTTTGFNTFENSVPNFVENLSSEPIKAEVNLWGLFTEEEIQSKITGQGAVDVDPWLGKGFAPGSLVVLPVNPNTNRNISEQSNLTVKLNNGELISSTPDTEGLFVFSALPEGTYTVDGEAEGYYSDPEIARVASADISAVTLRMWPLDDRVLPLIATIPDQSVAPGAQYTGPAPELERGSQPVTWELVESPDGMTMDANGVVSWTAPPAKGGPATVRIRATNSAGSDDETWMIQVGNQDPNDLNNDGSVNAVDVQLVINAVLGTASGGDVNTDGSVDAVDVQIVINAVLTS